MKKITLIIIGMLVLSLCFGEVYKSINLQVVDKTAVTVKIKFCEKLDDGRYFFVTDLYDADSVRIAIDRDFYDTNAPFQLKKAAELDTLLKVHPNYMKPIKIEKEILQ